MGFGIPNLEVSKFMRVCGEPRGIIPLRLSLILIYPVPYTCMLAALQLLVEDAMLLITKYPHLAPRHVFLRGSV